MKKIKIITSYRDLIVLSRRFNILGPVHVHHVMKIQIYLYFWNIRRLRSFFGGVNYSFKLCFIASSFTSKMNN